ncbi:MAG: DUF115 domain-containing protein, partial [Lachnospiraceae bacterium]|nr:DUF115 domain-containing protein [Lachnospiraceae bacterium]
MALIYDNNMASIRNRYPEYADKIEGALDKEYAIESNIAAVVDRSVLYVVKGTRQYQLDSLYENEEMLKIWAKDYTNSALFNVYTIFGFGNGMFVKKLIQSKGRDQDIKIIIYEPDMSIFKTTLLNFDISDIINNENITLYIPELTKTPFGTVLDTVINYKNLNNTYEAVYPNYPLLFPKELESFREAVRINAEAVRSSMDASEKLGNAFYNNLFANMESYINSRSLISLKEKLPNNPPVIVVSSGPSLSKNVAELKNAKGKAFIIAVDSAMPVMLHEGIMPDMYASIDGMKFLAHFEDERTKDIPVLTTSLATPGAIKEGQISFFEQSDDRYLNAFLEEKGIDLPKLSTGGTVANTAFAFAEYLEASAIILCGQDLAYTDDKAHADNALSDNNTISERSLTYTRDINGEEVKTSTEFMLYKDWFEREIATNNVRAIDATEGGARIEGTIIMPLSEAIAGY